MNAAFQYITDNGMSYPYEGKNDTCRYVPKNSGAQDLGFVNIKFANETALKAAVATQVRI